MSDVSDGGARLEFPTGTQLPPIFPLSLTETGTVLRFAKSVGRAGMRSACGSCVPRLCVSRAGDRAGLATVTHCEASIPHLHLQNRDISPVIPFRTSQGVCRPAVASSTSRFTAA
jgi:hypothetical protein